MATVDLAVSSSVYERFNRMSIVNYLQANYFDRSSKTVIVRQTQEMPLLNKRTFQDYRARSRRSSYSSRYFL